VGLLPVLSKRLDNLLQGVIPDAPVMANAPDAVSSS
jgi:hypothetical protein